MMADRTKKRWRDDGMRRALGACRHVGIYRALKVNTSNSMQHIRMLRGELWLNKGIIPAIIREVFETTFTPSLVIGAFKKCWIAPLCQDANSVALATKSTPVEREADEENHQGEGTVIANVVSPSQVLADAEVLTEVHVTFALQV